MNSKNYMKISLETNLFVLYADSLYAIPFKDSFGRRFLGVGFMICQFRVANGVEEEL